MRFKALLFDIDGTLLRAGGAGRLALAKALQELFHIENPSLHLSFCGRTDLSITRELFAKHDIGWSLPRAAEFLALYTHHFAEGLRHHQPELLPGVRPLLNQLSQTEHISLGLLTGNIQSCARLKLDHFQLWDYFNFGGFGDHHEERSGIAAHAFAQASALRNSGLKAQETLVIGDTPADVACARAIGAKVLAVGTGLVDRQELLDTEPDFFLEDLGHFEDFAQIL